MTNYNERQDEIFSFHDNCTVNCPHTFAEFDKAKQAITSLIKELVAEAKPRKYKLDGSTKKPNLASEYNMAIDQFEQNLLKALEEK